MAHFVTCNGCGESVDASLFMCPKCGSSTPSTPRWFRSSEFKFAGTLLLVLFLVSWLSNSSGINPSKARTTRRPAHAKTGELALLRVSGSVEIVALGDSEASFSRLGDLAIANDDIGIAKMLNDGCVFICKRNTKCRVIESGIFTYEVRILEGAHFGKSGIVASEHVFPSNR